MRLPRTLRALVDWWNRRRSRPAKPHSARSGEWGEEAAARHLAGQGMRIVERRTRVGRGEIDILAVEPGADGPTLVFVEVKTRRSEAYGGPVAALDERKRQALRKAAMGYLRRLGGPPPRVRFDLVAVIGEPESSAPPVIRHIPDILHLDARFGYR